MSDGPTEPTEPSEHTAHLDLGTEDHDPGGDRTRRVAIIAAVAVVVAAVMGGGAFAAYSLLSGGGPQPAEVLPASTVAVVSVDLDPSASQKIAAIKTIRKFPALKKNLGLEADDDLRKFVFDKVVANGDCKGLTFDDVKPWLGKRAAFAAVDLGGKKPTPAIALQVSDAAKAKKGFAEIVKCAHPQDFAYVVGGDYLIASDTVAHAKAILDDGQKKPLADDAAYQKWTGEAGDPGVVSFYVARKAANYVGRLAEEFGSGIGRVAADDRSAGSSVPGIKDFTGLGGTVRFADGGMELSMAAGGLKSMTSAATVGKQIGDLPKDTAVAAGFGVPDDYAEQLVSQLSRTFGGGDDLVTQAENQTGLDLPDDLQTLLGHTVTLSLGGDAPAKLDDLSGPKDVPAGVLIHGDAEKIKAVIAKAERHLGMSLSDIPIMVEGSGDKLALSPSSTYASDLLKSGDLASDEGFKQAVPEADRATGVLYVDFDSPWRKTLVDAMAESGIAKDAQEFDANTEPLKSLGLSSWADGDVGHALVKVTTD